MPTSCCTSSSETPPSAFASLSVVNIASASCSLFGDFGVTLRRILSRFLGFDDRDAGDALARRFESVRLGEVYRLGSSGFRFFLPISIWGSGVGAIDFVTLSRTSS